MSSLFMTLAEVTVWLTYTVGLLYFTVVYAGCWFAGCDDLTGALHVLQLQLSPPPPGSIISSFNKSRMETFW